MHSIFHIGQVQQIDGNDRLWQVDLTLTSDNDPQLYHLTESIREETSGSTGWDRLGQLMLKLGQLNKAEELYEILLKQSTNDVEKAHLYQENTNDYKRQAEFHSNKYTKTDIKILKSEYQLEDSDDEVN